jgi:serine/threonine protein kinase
MLSPPADAGCREGSEARVFLWDGIAVRRLKRRSAAAAMAHPHKLLLLQHPNLVRIFAVDAASGDICMEAMHLSLQDHAQDHVPGHPRHFPASLHIALAVAHGLCHLHARGMQHGDLCPSNVLLAHTHGETHVKLCDFYADHTGTSRTAAYAAPEVVTSPPSVMCAADVWAFACCLLFLEGVEPFHGFEEDPAKLFYLARHSCVAFREGGAFKPFALADCAYAPARHIGQTAWAPILAAAFVPEAARLSSQRLCDSLALLRPRVPHAPDTPNAPDTPHTHAHTHAKHAHTHTHTHAHRTPLRRLNFG